MDIFYSVVQAAFSLTETISEIFLRISLGVGMPPPVLP
jgi:hypothetical protein